jgi:acyl-CoA synthetase (AMP-forming)/AMP-acid ligase II
VSGGGTVLDRVLSIASRDPERTFAHVWHASRRIDAVSYGALVARAAGYAGGLKAGGVAAGDVVVIVVKPGVELLSAWLAPLLAGAIPSIFPWPTEKLSPEYYDGSVAALLSICGATALVTSRDLHPRLAHIVSGAPALRAVVEVEDFEPSAALPEVPRAHREDAEAITVLQHSSGSTGLQKGVALSSRAIFRQLESYGEALKVTAEDRVANWMPLYHDGGLIAGFLQPLLRPLPLSILSPIDWIHDPVLLLEAITRDRSTLCWLPNFAYNFLAGKIPERKLAGIDLSSMRAFVNTAEPVRASSHAVFLDRFGPSGLDPLALTTSYGTAENVLAMTQSDPAVPVRIDTIDRGRLVREGEAVPVPDDDPRSAAMVSSGAPIPGTRLRVVDADFRDLPERRVGEILLSSDCMLTEYFRRPDLTAAAFRDGWYRTGDAGYFSAGEIFVTGRRKDLIIVGGANVYPQDLEFVADGVAGVHPGRSVAFGVDNEAIGTEDVVVLVEADSGADERGVTERVRAAIAHQSEVVARDVRVVPAMWLVKTSSGKISRTRCREKYLKECRE